MPRNGVDLEKISEITNGFTGADMSMLSKESAMKALRRTLPEVIQEKGEIPEEIPAKILDKIEVNMDDFMNALLEIEPSGMRDAIVQFPSVNWEDVGGLDDAKKELKENVEWPLKYPHAYDSIGMEPPKGVLIWGPPGTGKTLLAKAVANEANANFIAVKGPELLSKWVGESERGVRKVFRKARQMAPSILFFDEIDSLASPRGSDSSQVSDRVLNQILTEMDGIENLRGVIVLAATNRPDLLDPALLRPGRFDVQIYTPMPGQETREKILKVHTKKMSLEKDVDFGDLSRRMDHYSGADISAVSREAAMDVVRNAVKKVLVAEDAIQGHIAGKVSGQELLGHFKGTPLESEAASLLEKNRPEILAKLVPMPEHFVEKVGMKDFKSALLKFNPSVNEDKRKFYEKLRSQFSG